MHSNEFQKFLEIISAECFPVLGKSIAKTKYAPIDLSESNPELTDEDLSSTAKFTEFINNHLKTHKASVAYGGYLEQRNIYKRSRYFNAENTESRNIHLGIDLWCAAETPVYAPLDGVVHSFKNNTNFGDYGPTIILKHNINGVAFFTLYGHLSLASITNLKVGQNFKKGTIVGALGSASVNGDYPPHLHFQIIKDLQDFIGDYPGVCRKSDLTFYESNCLKPDLLLRL
ncbi:peptidoglycan DD-metalloendopeptidase family protein [Tamlana crocina]|uniref:Peptidoglycan DD-metalloendopeptidase family protein n=1 Tax=Tamlana crocina TaxID=393006 RepID=A0ABX1D9E0_9FLAO|nr:peptidoglycan DD-metalloendopeptidase family protein [Tamlana crocina]